MESSQPPSTTLATSDKPKPQRKRTPRPRSSKPLSEAGSNNTKLAVEPKMQVANNNASTTTQVNVAKPPKPEGSNAAAAPRPRRVRKPNGPSANTDGASNVASKSTPTPDVKTESKQDQPKRSRNRNRKPAAKSEQGSSANPNPSSDSKDSSEKPNRVRSARKPKEQNNDSTREAPSSSGASSEKPKRVRPARKPKEQTDDSNDVQTFHGSDKPRRRTDKKTENSHAPRQDSRRADANTRRPPSKPKVQVAHFVGRGRGEVLGVPHQVAFPKPSVGDEKSKVLDDIFAKYKPVKARAPKVDTTAVVIPQPRNPTERQVLDLLPALMDDHRNTPELKRITALESILKLIADDEWFKFEPYIVRHILPVLLKRYDDKPGVIKMAKSVGETFINKVSIQAFPCVVNKLYVEMDVTSRWRAKAAALSLLNTYMERTADMDRDLLSASLPSLIPKIVSTLYDTKTEVVHAGDVAINTAMKGITNRDLEPFVPSLIEVMKDRDQTNETIMKLSSVVFVQTVDASALAVVIPLMVAGMRQPIVNIRRICSRIVGNMAKLVEDPLETEVFLDELIPEISDVVDTIPDPEAREVAVKTKQQLETLREQVRFADKAKSGRKPDKIAQFIKTTLLLGGDNAAANNNNNNNNNNDDNDDETILYVANICSSLILTKTTEESEWESEPSPYLKVLGACDKWGVIREECIKNIGAVIIAEEKDEGTELCNCEFTLAYGTKILLRNTKLRLLLGMKYGLLGGNDCGKTTLMKAIADGSIDGFPDRDEVTCVFVEADIQGELSHLNCVNYILEWPAVKAAGFTQKQVRDTLLSVGFTEGKAAGAGGDCDDPISSLSGGWRMKLALARAMLQKADILLMDEPTNHLDVSNVKWVMGYVKSLQNTTCVMVSHDPKFLDECCTHMISFNGLKLETQKGNLSEFKKTHPEAQAFFEFKSSKFSFSFPQPSFLEGVKSRGKVLLKMDDVTFTYPGNTVPTIFNISVRASMASRVACVGKNGAGKSTMVKVLTGQQEPQKGTVWKMGAAKIGYIAQHAFVHIEQHLNKTPNEYLRWRYQFGDDREGLDQANMKISDEDKAALALPVEFKWKNEKGEIKKENRVIDRCTGQRRDSVTKKKVWEYELAWKGRSVDSNSWYTAEELIKFNKLYEKMIRIIDAKVLARESMLARPLTSANVEKHLAGVGLEAEYATHFRMAALSDGQKVKVVLGAAMWDQPHIIILDEPTNYLDRESLGALADAIDNYEGGVIMITHNDAFCSQLCPERWVLEDGRLNTEGDVDWMAKLEEEAITFEEVTEMVDASGNKVTATRRKTLNAKDKKKVVKAIRAKIVAEEDLDSDEEFYAIEFGL